MECDTVSTYSSNPVPSTPTTTLSSPLHSPLPPVPQPLSVPISPPLRSPTDECFHCKRPGHWRNECPNKTPKKSAPSSPCNNNDDSSTIKPGSVSPMVRCPCGRGFCLRFISKTVKNPGRIFYSCPVDKNLGQCSFFMWYDQLISITARTPMCPCGAGMCSVNKASSPGPNGERWYYACRIRRDHGHGACDFFQWADPESDGCESKASSSLQSRYDAAINDLNEKENTSSIHVELPLAQNAEDPPNQAMIAVNSDQDDIPNRDIVMQEVESLDPMTAKPLEVSQPLAQSQSLLLKELWRQISVAGNSISEDVIYRSLGVHVYGWLGRLAFPPSQCLKDPPPVPIFVYIFPSFKRATIPEDVDMSDTEGSFHLPHRVSNAETNMPPPGTSRQDAQLSDAVFSEPSELKDSSDIVQENVSMKSILKTFGQVLFDIFESMNPLDSEQMLKVAEPTFMAFQKLSIEFCPFVEGVKKYIHHVSVLTSIEGMIQEGPSSQELTKLHDSDKVNFDSVCCLHTEAEAAYTASKNHLQSLHEEVLRVKGILVELEKQLVDCEVETAMLKARVDEVAEDVLASKTTTEAASRKMMKALELEQQRESARDAAKVALEGARVWLEEL